jgi:hypothetical protein
VVAATGHPTAATEIEIGTVASTHLLPVHCLLVSVAPLALAAAIDPPNATMASATASSMIETVIVIGAVGAAAVIEAGEVKGTSDKNRGNGGEAHRRRIRGSRAVANRHRRPST